MSVNVKGLRLGNKLDGGEVVAIHKNYFTIHDGYTTWHSNMMVDDWVGGDGIPLTEEWFLKFGFIKSKGKYGHDYYILSEDKTSVEWLIEHWIEIPKDSVFYNHFHVRGLFGGNKLEYVHQLQNMYFALCGKELKIIENK